MIYVIDFDLVDKSSLSGKMTFAGCWCYYYGNGEWGNTPVKGDGEVNTDPAFNWSTETLPEDTGSTLVGTTAAPETTADPETTAAPEPTDAPETTAAPATTVPAPGTDPTSSEDVTTGTTPDAPATGGVVTYIYFVLGALVLAACAVVVLRKKANG